MVTHPLDDRAGPRVANTEPLSRTTADEHRTRRGAVTGDVANDDVLGGHELRPPIGKDRQLPPRQPLPEVVVGVPLDEERDSLRQEGADALPGRALEPDRDRPVGQTSPAVLAGQPTPQHGPHRAVDVPDGQAEFHPFPPCQRRLGLLDQLVVERGEQPVVLRFVAVDFRPRRHIGAMQQHAEIEPLRLPVVNRPPGVEQIDPANHLVQRAEAQLGHQLAQFLGDKAEEVDHVLGLAGELRPQLGILRGDAHRARIQVADPHHDASGSDQRGAGDAKFLGTQQRGDCHIATRLQLPVGLHHDAAAEVVNHQRLVRLGQPEFPGDAGVLDRGERAGPGSPFIARDEHHVGLPLGHPRGHRPDANLRHQFHAHPRLGVRVLQVVDELGQVFDRVDVVVGRGRNEPDARGRVPDLGDVLIDLVSGQLPPFTGLRPLRHLDLQFVGIDQVFAGHTEPARGDLLDRAAAEIAIGVGPIAHAVFAPFARVALAANAVHGNRQRLVRLARD